jgi:hypothetical protein
MSSSFVYQLSQRRTWNNIFLRLRDSQKNSNGKKERIDGTVFRLANFFIAYDTHIFERIQFSFRLTSFFIIIINFFTRVPIKALQMQLVKPYLPNTLEVCLVTTVLSCNFFLLFLQGQNLPHQLITFSFCLLSNNDPTRNLLQQTIHQATTNMQAEVEALI